MNGLVYIIMLNWNNWQDTIACISSAYKSTYKNFKLLVVDNCSTDDSAAKIKKFCPNIEFIISNSNLGFTGGNNLGINYALNHGADYVFILNNDTEIDPQCLSECVKFAESDKKIGALCPLILFHKRPKRIWYRGIKLIWPGIFVNMDQGKLWNASEYDRPYEVEMLTGCAMLIKKKALQRVGGFDEKLFMYAEDVDLSFRLTRAGYRLFCVPDAVVWHKIDINTRNVTPLNSYYGTRNRLVILRKYGIYKLGICLAFFLIFMKNMFLFISNREVAKAKTYALKDFVFGNMDRRY